LPVNIALGRRWRSQQYGDGGFVKVKVWKYEE
jgi:hypothetical protein